MADKIQLINLILEGSGHACSIVKTRKDIYLFNAIVICSGDGLIFEVLIFNLLINTRDESCWKFLFFKIFLDVRKFG